MKADKWVKIGLVVGVTMMVMAGWNVVRLHEAQRRCDFIVRIERVRDDLRMWPSSGMYVECSRLNQQLAVYKSRGIMEYVPYVEEK